MEQTYNDILAENQRLKKEVRKLKRELSFATITANNYESQLAEAKKEAAAQYHELRKEFSFVIGELNAYRLMHGLPTYEEEKASENKSKQNRAAVADSGCKVISLARINR